MSFGHLWRDDDLEPGAVPRDYFIQKQAIWQIAYARRYIHEAALQPVNNLRIHRSIVPLRRCGDLIAHPLRKANDIFIGCLGGPGRLLIFHSRSILA